MAQRNYTSNSSFSWERMPIRLMGSITQSGATGTFASKVTQGLTLTAVTMGTGGNSITIAFTGGGTAGAEVVTVVGNAISVQIQSGVSTVTQVRTALNASTAAAALVTTTGTSASTVATASALPLLTGTSTAFTIVGLQSVTVAQIGTGVFKLTMQDPFAALLNMNILIKKSSATDIKPQIQSVNTLATGTLPQSIVIRTIAVATPTDLASGDSLYIGMDMRNNPSTLNGTSA